MFYWRFWPSGEREKNSQPINFINIDYDFFNIYSLQMAAGRFFDRALGSDLESPGYVINEAAVKAFGWNSPEEAIGKSLMDNRGQIIGVVKDFNFKGLQNKIEPLGMSVWSDHFGCFTLTINTQNLDKTTSYVEKVFTTFFPGEIFDYYFLDDFFNRQYRFEEKISRIFGVFTFLGIFIACLGLFGLASFIAEQRTKEIGIRKVLGASTAGIMLMLSKEFGIWIMTANIIAIPAAWYAADKWLQNFAYKITPGFDIFILTGLATLVFALTIVCYQSLKAAQSNPVNSLRCE